MVITGPMNDISQRTFTEIGVSDIPLGVLVVERFALLTVASHGVVLTVVTHSPADVPSGQENRHVKVTGAGMFVAVAFCMTRTMSRTKLLNIFTNGGWNWQEGSSFSKAGTEFE